MGSLVLQLCFMLSVRIPVVRCVVGLESCAESRSDDEHLAFLPPLFFYGMTTVGLVIFLFAYEATRGFMIRVLAWGLGAWTTALEVSECFFPASCRCSLCTFFSLFRTYYNNLDEKASGNNMPNCNVQVILPHPAADGKLFVAGS